MSNKPISKKIKIIQFKDIVSLLVIVVMLSSTLIYSYGAANSSTTSTSSTIKYERELAMFSALVNVDLENISEKKEDGKYYSIYNPNTSLPKRTTLDIIYGRPAKITPINQPMVTDTQLSTVKDIDTTFLGIDLSYKLSGENAYNFWFNNLASTFEVWDWKIYDYTKINAYNTSFVAMTFKKGNDMVIAYRSPNVKILDTSNITNIKFDYNNLQYIFNFKTVVREYANLIATNNKNSNIYITGWGFGGYYAQVAGAQLVRSSTTKNQLKEILYFNSPGLGFYPKLKNDIKTLVKNLSNGTLKIDNLDLAQETELAILLISYLNQDKKDDLLNPLLSKLNSIEFTNSSDTTEYSTLKKWYKNGGIITSYETKINLLSFLGNHAGAKKEYYASSRLVKQNSDSNTLIGNIANLYKIDVGGYAKIGIDEIIELLSKNLIIGLSETMASYDNPNILESFILTHDNPNILQYFKLTQRIDNFWISLPQNNKFCSTATNFTISFDNVPEAITTDTSHNITLTIISPYKLSNSTLRNYNFKTSGDIKIEKVTKLVTGAVVENGYKYTYNIKIKRDIQENIKIKLKNFLNDALTELKKFKLSDQSKINIIIKLTNISKNIDKFNAKTLLTELPNIFIESITDSDKDDIKNLLIKLLKKFLEDVFEPNYSTITLKQNTLKFNISNYKYINISNNATNAYIKYNSSITSMLKSISTHGVTTSKIKVTDDYNKNFSYDSILQLIIKSNLLDSII